MHLIADIVGLGLTSGERAGRKQVFVCRLTIFHFILLDMKIHVSFIPGIISSCGQARQQLLAGRK